MKKLLAIVLLVCLLSGCSLAAQGDGLVTDHELMGFLLTVSLEENGTITDVWDAEAAGMEPLHLMTMEGQKLYANRTEGAETSYEFPEGCGLSCYCFYVFSDVEGETYRSSIESPELSDVHRTTHVGNGTTNHLEATIYATGDSTTAVYLNPVYQTPEGEVYALGTAPMGYDVGSMYGCSVSLSQAAKIRMGEDTITSASVKLNIERVMLPERYIIFEMSEENQPLRRTEFAPEDMPERYVAGADTAYIILEAAGEETFRTVYSPDDKSAVMDTFYPGQYGLCVKGYTRIEWEGVS